MKDNLFLSLLYGLLFCVFIWVMYLDHDYRKFDSRILKLEEFISQFSLIESGNADLEAKSISEYEEKEGHEIDSEVKKDGK